MLEKAKEIVHVLKEESLDIERLKELIVELADMIDDEESK